MSKRSQAILSPLRYPGSKRRLVKYIQEALSLNNLKPKLYVEPFIGGGSVALQLLKDGNVENAIFMDIDPWVTSFWQTVFFDTEWLIEQISTIEVSIEKWREIKQTNPKTIREQALTCFFLNRTNFSGILENKAGPIGGKEQKSDYKIDCRFMRDALIYRIGQAALLNSRVYGVWNCSWLDGIKRIRLDQETDKFLKNDLFFYFDPPFFEHANTLYRFYFHEFDHIELRDYLLTLTDKWILSYDYADKVEELYGNALKNGINGTHRHHVELLYSLARMSTRKRETEVIISNLGKLPKDEAQTADARVIK